MNQKIPKKIRLDSSLYSKPDWVYYITIVSNFKKQYFLKDELNMKIIECLKQERKRCGCKVFVYCLMPEHLHFLCSVRFYPNKYAHKGLHYQNKKPSIIDFVNQFKGKSTVIAWKYGIKGSLWQKRWYDHILRKDEDLVKAGEYILNNPVRRKLVEDYYEYLYCGYIDEVNI